MDEAEQESPGNNAMVMEDNTIEEVSKEAVVASCKKVIFQRKKAAAHGKEGVFSPSVVARPCHGRCRQGKCMHSELIRNFVDTPFGKTILC
jgi:hypothetical protein